MEYLKAKSASKIVLPKGPLLEKKILETMKVISEIVGGTLGPGGHPVLIERQEDGLAPIITKDGVTVFRSIGFSDPIAQCIMETARDTSVRTANEAGDGTTTAAILAEAFVRLVKGYCKRNPTIPPQQVIREIQLTYKNNIEPLIKKLSVKCNLDSKKGHKLLEAVATLSGNGDKELGKAVMECYDICGDDGNVTIIENSGPFGYEVEQVQGYPIPMGYEESCQKFYPMFINEPATQRIVLDKPAFLLYFGRLNDIQTILNLLEKLAEAWKHDYLKVFSLVIVATGFSDNVIAALANNMVSPQTLHIVPLCIPQSPMHNGGKNFMDDLAAVTDAKVFDPLTAPVSDIEGFEGIGNLFKDEENVYRAKGVRTFECSRFRSTIVGFADEERLAARVVEVEGQAAFAESTMDSVYLKERLAKLSGGIAKLKVIGSSNGELKERRDRAEDAVCAVRGAIQHGALIGGGWTLAYLAENLPDTPVCKEIIEPALSEPIEVLWRNAGVPEDGLLKLRDRVLPSVKEPLQEYPKSTEVFDAAKGEFCNAIERGILDSVPSVRDAIKNAISNATLLGTLGGTVVFPRDREVEMKECRDAAEWERMKNYNPNDEKP
jgi:Chaperonin GroEL (HSP60 family)